jgi:class 3 adenylate cyclase
MESQGVPGKIHVSSDTYDHLKNKFTLVEAKQVTAKERTEPIKTYFLIGKKETQEQNPNFVDDGPSASEHTGARMPALSLSIANPIWKHLNQEIDDLTNIKLDKITLAFPLKEIEKEFTKYFFEKNLKSMRLGALIILAFICLLELVDPALRGSSGSETSIVIRITRYGAVTPACLFLFGYSWFPSFEKYMQPSVMVLVILFYTMWIIGGFFSELHFMGIAFAHIATFFMLKLYFKYSSISAAVFQIVFIIAAIVEGFVGLLGVFMTLMGVFAYGLLTNYQFERYIRMTFVNEKLLDMEKERLKIEQAKSEELLVNLLPVSIAQQLKNGEQTIANKFTNVTIMFVHIVGLTALQHELELKELFKLVNNIFCKYDDLTEIYKIEKIKTIGSSYMVASGLESVNTESREALREQNKRMLELAMEMLNFMEEFNEDNKKKSKAGLLEFSALPILNIRVGIHMGPIVAGVIGKKKFVSHLICPYS